MISHGNAEVVYVYMSPSPARDVIKHVARGLKFDR